MRGTTKRDTRREMRPRSALRQVEARFQVQRQIAPAGISVRPNLVFGPAKFAVFVDARFGHGHSERGISHTSNARNWRPKLERNRRRDQIMDEALNLARWPVVQNWEQQALSETNASVMAALEREP